jgi:DNA repair photolyase
MDRLEKYKKFVAIGFSLSGHDELEPNASTNSDRIMAMIDLRAAGFKTWASIEPIIDFDSSLSMIERTFGICDLYKIGLEAGKKYDKDELLDFMSDVNAKSHLTGNECKIYYKDGLLKQAGISRSELPSNCVDRDYNIFKNQ